MDTRHIVRISAIAIVAALLLTLVVAIPAFAAESTSTAATTAVGAAAAPKATEAAPSEGAAKAGEKKEIPHVVGHPSTSQLEDLRRAWTSIPGFDLLLVSILGIVVTVGIIGFGAFKQMKV
jgi:hypothetical protein